MVPAVIRIPLKHRRVRGLYAIVDDSTQTMHAWRAMQSSSGTFYAYRVRKISGTRRNETVYLHRAVFGHIPRGAEIDHRNGDPLDCRRSNLRICTHADNSKNVRPLRKNNTSGLKGVTAFRGRWRAYIVANGIQISLGLFDIKDHAGAAYDSAAISLFGTFASLNGLIKGTP